MDYIERNYEHSENTTKSSRELIIAKVVAMAVLGIVSFIIGMLPIKLTKCIKIDSGKKHNNLVVSLLLCFGGGVLLFTTFIHLQPEVREALESLESQGKITKMGGGVPLSELVFCLGFFFVYFIEEIVHYILDKRSDHNHDALHRTLSVKCNNNNHKENLTIPRVALNKTDDGSLNCINNSTKDLLNSQSNIAFVSNNNNNSHYEEHNGHSHVHFEHSMKNSFRGFLAVLALSFHAVFEGLAVGLEGNTQKVWYLFAAIATHKFVIAFCVGIELVVAKTRTVLLFLYIGTFAVVTPLGIGIGLLLSETRGGSQGDVVSNILQGMAAGTLLYVVFFEVLARERSNQHSGVLQLLAILAGFGIMFGLQFTTSHDHGHSHADHDHDNDH